MSAIPDRAETPKRRVYNKIHTGIRDGKIVKLKNCPGCGVEGLCSEGPESDYYPKHIGGKVRYQICKKCDKRIKANRIEEARGQRETWIASPAYHRQKETHAAQARARRNERRRIRHAERMETDPAYAKRAREEWRRANAKRKEDPERRVKERAAGRRYRQRLRREDPERLREAARMNYALRQGRLLGRKP